MSARLPLRHLARWLTAHLAVAIALLGVGCSAEWWHMGTTSEQALGRIRASLEADISRRADRLERQVSAVLQTAALPDAIRGAPTTRPTLFAMLDAVEGTPASTALTLYGEGGAVLAWSGRASDTPAARVLGDRTFFVAPGALGWRLMYAAVVNGETGSPVPSRLATVVAEDMLTSADGVDRTPATSFEMPTILAPVTLWPTRFAPGPTDDAYFGFTIRARGDTPLLEARVERAAIDAQRAAWRRRTWQAVAGYAALVTLLGLLQLASASRPRRLASLVPILAGGLALAALARILLAVAVPQEWRTRDLAAPGLFDTLRPAPLFGSPVDLAATLLVVVGLVACLPPLLRGLRVITGPLAMRLRQPRDLVPLFGTHFIAGAAVAAIAHGVERIVESVAAAPRLGAFEWPFIGLVPLHDTIVVALILLAIAALWSSVAILFASGLPFRSSGPLRGRRTGRVLAWLAPSALVVLASTGTDVPGAIWKLSWAAAAALTAWWLTTRGVSRLRRASQSQRLLLRFAAVWLPVLLLYPGLRLESDRTRREIVANRYAGQVIAHPQFLQARLTQALARIDEVASSEIVEPLTVAGGPSTTGPAFLLWRRTVLATDRLTSAVELYGANGDMVSRFALNFPEYAVTAQKWTGRSCTWDVFGETMLFGATERRMLHAERGICSGGPSGSTIVAGIVVHVMLDYPVLPFISSPDPYAEFFRPAATDPVIPDTVLVIYGWGRSPVYTSGPAAWPLDDALFARVVADADRTPFWEVLPLAGREYEVFFSNDRQGIYAIGVPRHSWFEHFVYLSELTTLTGLLFVAWLVITTVGLRATGALARTGLELIADIRRSFYRKLFLAFVGASVVPVVVLAVLVRNYVATRWRAEIEAEAGRTAAVAQRVIEESLDLQQAVATPVTLSDDVMVWISRIIDQDVNIFDGPDLLATSERDLFESGLLPTRLSPDVFRAVVVDRRPNFVGEDRIAGFRFLTAAVPIRVGNLDTILTVPMALRQQETERKIEELDRGVNLAALVFVMLGAAGGFWMAERIGDPVTRLSRATRRLAAGDLSVRAMVKSADELERLVEDFNRMAEQLALQRVQLERTHRLEAWADVARQVAHDIKNPLTPIQLSAEHLRRVNQDRGAPLSPVLDGCIDTILSQVRLLRRISSEFSSFASTPTPRLAPTPLLDVLKEVVGPYEASLPAATRIVWRVDDPLPVLPLDRTLLGRALINVVDNALHAMPEGGTLTVGARVAPARVTVDISDTGLGMDAEAVSRIFEPYFSTKTTGTGLGLTIAKRNVELHGGAIQVVSARGVGTCVTITLPLPGEAADRQLPTTGESAST